MSEYRFPINGSNPYSADSAQQSSQPSSSSPLARTGNAPSPSSAVPSNTAAPLSAAGQVPRSHWNPVIARGAQGTPHQGPTIPAGKDSQFGAMLAKQREKAGDDSQDEVAVPAKKASWFSRATHKVAKRAGLTTSSLKQPSQIQPQEEPAQSDDDEVTTTEGFVFVQGKTSSTVQAEPYEPSPAEQLASYCSPSANPAISLEPAPAGDDDSIDGPSFEELNRQFELLKARSASSQPPASSYAEPLPVSPSYPSYVPLQPSYQPYAAPAYSYPAVDHATSFSAAPLRFRSTIGYAAESSESGTSYRCTMNFDSTDIQTQLAHRPDYNQHRARQQLNIAADALVDAVNQRVFQKNYGANPEEIEYSTIYKSDVQQGLADIKLLLQEKECMLSVVCQPQHSSFIGKIKITAGQAQQSLEWPRWYEFRGLESSYANDSSGWGARFSNQQKCETLFAVFAKELEEYQQAWAVVKQLESASSV